MVADNEDCIVIEQTYTTVDNYYNNPFRVLANQPNFNWHLENIKNYLNITPEVPNPIEGKEA